MPLHLLGKKSWNVYNPANIARVKADEEAAAAREAAREQRMQELDAERRAAILRGRTPPPLPADVEDDDTSRRRTRDDRGHDRKRRKLAGEDDTDADIRMAKSVTAPGEDDNNQAKILKLRNEKSDAPLTDHAGHIDLFPVDMKEAVKREKNAEVEKEKKRKERSFEDQYTMRFSNAAGRGGLDQPWYTTQQQQDSKDAESSIALELSTLESKNVWGNEDPLRKEREKTRIASSDPFAFMQQAQKQLKKSKADKQKWAAERDRDLQQLRAAQEREDRRDRHRKRKRREENGDESHRSEHGRSLKSGDNSRSDKHQRHDHERSHREDHQSRDRRRDHKPDSRYRHSSRENEDRRLRS